MDFWLRAIRYIILTGSIILAGAVFLWARYAIAEPELRFLRLDEIYAIIAITFLYFALLASPLTLAFPRLPFRVVYIKARRALGVSAFLFGTLHASISFFVLVGGYAGLLLLPLGTRIAVSFGTLAFLILLLLAATSFNFMVRFLGRWWKLLHRLVYLAAIFILIHGTLLGTQLSNRRHPITLTVYVAVAFLLVLEGLRIYRFLRRKFSSPTAPNSSNTS